MSDKLGEGKQAADVHPFDLGWRERVLVLGPLFLILGVSALLANRYASEMLQELFLLIPVAFFAVGKFLPLWGISGESSFGPYQLGAVIWALDTFSVLIFVYSFEAFYRIPFLRKVLDRVNHNMELVLEMYPRMKRASVVGVILFVLFPVSGTGALAASFIGVLLRMNRLVLIVAVSFGGCLGGFLMAFLASNFGSALESFEALQQNPTYKYAVLGGFWALLALLLFAANRMFRHALEKAEQAHQKSVR